MKIYLVCTLSAPHQTVEMLNAQQRMILLSFGDKWFRGKTYLFDNTNFPMFSVQYDPLDYLRRKGHENLPRESTVPSSIHVNAADQKL